MEKTRKLPVWSNKLAAWIIPVVVVILWAIWGTTQSSSNSLLPTIEQVWKGFLRLLKDGTLWENIKISTFRAFKGLFWGGAIGFTLGVINGISRKMME